MAMRRLIGRVVSDMVSEIEECGDGSEAVAAYNRFLPDWVLMDIEMEQMDGITARRERVGQELEHCFYNSSGPIWFPRRQ